MKLLGPRLLVALAPDEAYFKGSNSIIRPDTVHETAMGIGKVLNVGTGTSTENGRAPIEGVEVGDKVAFVKFLKETQTNKAISHTIGEENLIIELKDVVAVMPG